MDVKPGENTAARGVMVDASGGFGVQAGSHPDQPTFRQSVERSKRQPPLFTQKAAVFILPDLAIHVVRKVTHSG